MDQHVFPDCIRVIEFPAYSPDLNPMERLWDMVKACPRPERGDAVSNEVWETLIVIESAISAELRPFWECVSRVFQFLGDN